jgi:NAD(P)-dependent dehydrogenase (short-subunit alcohol dehydrogenase family)
MDREATATMSLIHQVQSSDHEKGMGVHPEDIANALLFLISSRSRSTNGAVIPIDNAWSTI